MGNGHQYYYDWHIVHAWQKKLLRDLFILYYCSLQHRPPWVIKFPFGEKVKNELTFSVIFHHRM
jgi:hypothetical protein